MNARNFSIDSPSKNTCEWILKNTDYQEWSDRGRGIFCIRGGPGTGKSTLMKFIQSKRAQAKSSIGISFYFHGRGTDDQISSSGLFRTLLHQLLDHQPQALADLVLDFGYRRDQASSHEGHAAKWSTDELRHFFKTCLAKILDQCAVQIFVDALDECHESEAVTVFNVFKQLDAKYSQTKFGLAICLSCRHAPMIIPRGMYSEVSVEQENRRDIISYIKDQLSWLLPEGDDEEQASLAALQKKVGSKANGVFLWANLIVSQICHRHHVGHSTIRLLHVLDETPSEWEDLYHQIISKVEDKNDSLRPFRWICFTGRRLTLSKVREAMNVEASYDLSTITELTKNSDFIKTDEQMEKRVRSISGGMAEVQLQNGYFQSGGRYTTENFLYVQLIHQSVKDFMFKSGLVALSASALATMHISIGQTHLHISKCCIQYLSLKDPQGRTDDDYDKEFPFACYALRFWQYHELLAESNGAPIGITWLKEKIW